MKILMLSGNPKQDGLCASIAAEIRAGLAAGGAQLDEVRLQEYEIARCHVCGDGWGTCRSTHVCAFGEDGFTAVSDRIAAADAVVLLTPVYWGETAETLKSFLDRFRRCQFGNEGALAGKQVLLVASAGGSGNGLLTCLEQMDRFCRHTGALIFDLIGVNRWTADYKRPLARAAATRLAAGSRPASGVPAAAR